MFQPLLKRFVVVVAIVVSALFARAQQTHFVYLQTEGGQSFYVKVDNKIISSSAAGYLILAKLPDGVYKLNIGFPKNEFPEEDFQILVDKKNEGFLLKNFGEKGWGLFNMQSYGVVMGGNIAFTAVPAKNLQDDPFSKLLANVVKDSTILQKNEPLKEEAPAPKTDSGKMKFDSLIAKANSTDEKVDSIIAAVEKTAPLPLFPPTRFLNKKSKDGREMIYIDHNQNMNDTIRIFIPSGKPITKAANVDTGVVQNISPPVTTHTDSSPVVIEQPATQMKPDTTLAVSPEKKNIAENKDSSLVVIEQPAAQVKPDTTLAVQPEKKNIDENKDTIVAKKPDEVKQPEIKSRDSVTAPANKAETTKDDIVVLPKVVQSSSTNSDCKAFAANEDFLKLRKKMASENSEDNMIKIAKKAFHLKCFSTEQIKNLSFLFLTNSGKYMFFDLAYPFASDSDQYDTLQSQLTDSYYINRFKAMIHK